MLCHPAWIQEGLLGSMRVANNSEVCRSAKQEGRHLGALLPTVQTSQCHEVLYATGWVSTFSRSSAYSFSSRGVVGKASSKTSSMVLT